MRPVFGFRQRVDLREMLAFVLVMGGVACGDADRESSDAAGGTFAGTAGNSGEFSGQGGAAASAGSAAVGGSRAAAAGTGAAIAGASGSAGATSEACTVEAPTECSEPMPTYADVAPLFEARCTSCHSGTGGNWPLNTYGHVVTWGDIIRAALLECKMPPADSGLRLPASESLLILRWIRCGMPR